MALQGRKKKKKKPASSNAKLLIKLAKARRQLRITKRKHLDSPLEAALLRVLEKLNPTSTQDKAPVASDGFPNFMKLPPDLRVKIWEMALPGSRIFEPYLIEHPAEHRDDGDIRARLSVLNNATLHLTHKHRPPNIRGVCKEAWKITEKHGHFCLGTYRNQDDGYWFNPRLDILYICPKPNMSASSETSMEDMFYMLDSLIRRVWRVNAENIAVWWPLLACHYDRLLEIVDADMPIRNLFAVFEMGAQGLLVPDEHWLREPVLFRIGDDKGLQTASLPPVLDKVMAWPEFKVKITHLFAEATEDLEGMELKDFNLEPFKVMRLNRSERT